MATHWPTGRAGWLIIASFAVALLLTAVPLPFSLRSLAPDWVCLVFIYWVLALPERVGVAAAFAAGLMLDVLEGAVLGRNALSLAVVAGLTLVLHQRVRLFSRSQQVILVFALTGISQLVGQWLQGLEGGGQEGVLFLLPAVTSALLWPGVSALMEHLHRHFAVD